MSCEQALVCRHTLRGRLTQPLQDSGLWMETSLRQGPLSAGTHSGGGLTPASAGLRPVSGDKSQTTALVRGHTLRREAHTSLCRTQACEWGQASDKGPSFQGIKHLQRIGPLSCSFGGEGGRDLRSLLESFWRKFWPVLSDPEDMRPS